MIVDAHYHFIPTMTEKAAAGMVNAMVHEAKKMGLNPDPAFMLKTAAETWGDPTCARLIDKMDEGGIDVTVAVMVDDCSNKNYTHEKLLRANKLLRDAAANHPQRIIPLAGLDPRRPEAVEMARIYLEEYGMRGLKYHPDYGYDPAGPDSYKVLEVVARNKGVLLSHTGPLMPPARSALAEPILLSHIAVDFPEITVIAAHMGGYINWRPWASLASVQPTLYGDLAMWDFLAFSHYEAFCRELRAAIDLVGVDKILFGSDAPIQTLLHPIKKWVQLIKDLPEKAPAGVRFTQAEVEKILGGNARIIFNLNS